MTNPIPNFGQPDTRPGYAFQSPGSVGGIDLSAILQALIQGSRLKQGQEGLDIERQRTEQAGSYQQGLIANEQARQAAEMARQQQEAANQGQVGRALQALMSGGQPFPTGMFTMGTIPEMTLEQVVQGVSPQNVPALLEKAGPVVKRVEERKAEARAKAAADALLKNLSPDDRASVGLYIEARNAGMDAATAAKLFGGMVSPTMAAQIDRDLSKLGIDTTNMPNVQKAELWVTAQKEKLQLLFRPPDREPKLRPLPPSVIRTVSENKASLSTIKEAMGLMDAMVKQGGKVTGLGWTNFWLGDEIKNQLGLSSDEEIDLRAAIGDLGSLVITDRSGKAVTAKEFPRLRPFIPKGTDPPQKVKRLLGRFARIVQEETDLYLENFGPDQGYHPIQGVTGTKTEETPPPAGDLYSKWGLERPKP